MSTDPNDHIFASKVPHKVAAMQSVMGVEGVPSQTQPPIPPNYNGIQIQYKTGESEAKTMVELLKDSKEFLSQMVTQLKNIQPSVVNNYGGQFGPSTIKDALRITQVV